MTSISSARKRDPCKLISALCIAVAGYCASAVAEPNSVSAGTSRDLDQYRALRTSEPPSPLTLDDVVGIGIAGSDDHVYVWYRDGTVSSGSSEDLDEYRERRSYVLPPGKLTRDVVGMAIAGSNDWVYTWYRDGTVSAGSSTNLAQYRAPTAYSLPPGKRWYEIGGMGIAGSNDRVYVWFTDWTVSSGTSVDLDAATSPQSFSVPPGWTAADIVEMGIAGSNDHVYAWFDVCSPRTGGESVNFGNIAQETNQWCWAASASLIMEYVGNLTVPQCTQANDRFSRVDCCNTPTPAACIRPAWPDFGRYGFSADWSGALRWPEIRRQIRGNSGSCHGRPFGFTWDWMSFDPATGTYIPDGTAHMMVAVGYSVGTTGKRYVEVQDPGPPNTGDYRIDEYNYWVGSPPHHVHSRNVSNVRW